MNINDVELSILASISKGYTAGQILETIYKVIHIKHENKYSNNICTSDDFIPLLTIKSPVFIDEENKIKVKTPIYFLFHPFKFIELVCQNSQWYQTFKGNHSNLN
jgi:hypothetical protein